MEVVISGEKAYKARRASLHVFKALAEEDRLKILELLSKKPLYPRKIAEELNLHEQRVYYHLRILKSSGLVEEVESSGNVKLYKALSKALYFLPPSAEEVDFRNVVRFPSPPEILKGFIEDGKIRCKVVVGAPYRHGKYGKASKSTYLAGEVACLLGNYGVSTKKLVYTDEEVGEEELKDNLIIIGGLLVNTVEEMVNDHLPIKFSRDGSTIISSISGEEYVDPDCGFICRARNPFDESKSVIVIAGIESVSTKACVYAFKTMINRINKGNMYNRDVKARVIKVMEGGEVIFLE